MNYLDFLIVDDDKVFTSTLERALTRRQYSCAVANDSSQALLLAERFILSKAVVDLKIGTDSGLQLIRELKNKNPNVAIIMLTGYSSISTAVEAVKSGAINYLCKPADANEILSAFGDERIAKVQEISYVPLSVERLEWEHIQKILLENDGNISATARALGMHRRTLQRKLQKRPVKQ